MRLQNDSPLRELLEREWTTFFDESRCELREYAREKITEVQRENRNSFYKRRKTARNYAIGDLVAIKRTQQGPGAKLSGKYFGPYRVTRALRNDRYLVERVGDHDGPRETSTAAEYMKIWVHDFESDQSDEENAECI
ncbi:hypothetical protein WN55_06641 [Dufourea novaeangliae]|uniref:Uncharacterized protein n=1 Tax=Dufourea novaeangliae TaxID=178035 RepID=A0A154PR81_DUFNO|nr:hypothetical protein WN55_06641 [Dufourea novaeangliae]